MLESCGCEIDVSAENQNLRDNYMANKYEVIDDSTWERAMHCMVFRNSIEPAFCVTFEADVTEFKKKVKEEGLSFTLAMVYAVCKCANEVEALRYRFLDGKVVLYERIDTAFTYLNKETELFKVVNVPFIDNLPEYVALALKTAEEQQEYFTGPLGNDVFQCSPMPWVTYTHISHTNSGKKDNATPLFDWGKYYEKDERVLIPISIQAHHSFVDGIHIGQFVDALQKFFNEY
jgi:chloramphenicol O-acetyltransferase type B